MRAYEHKKDVKAYGNDRVGVIWMIVGGNKEQVQAVCSILDNMYNNDECPDDNGEFGYAEGYYIDRCEKQDFMAAYKAAKKEIK